MQNLKITLTVKVPSGIYCNLVLKQKSTPSTRCRFCTEVQRGYFVCALYNTPLLVEAAVSILKAPLCCKKTGTFPERSETPEVPVQDLINEAIGKYQEIYDSLMDNGISAKIAKDIARKEICK